MELIIAEKPSVGKAIAAVVGANSRQDGYLQGEDYLVSWCIGHLVELATSDELFAHPLHPYTRSLLSAIPLPDPRAERNRRRIPYDPLAEHDYSQEQPTLREIVPGHFVRCNDAEEAAYKKELGL